MGAAEVTAFLSWLATERNAAAATQNQALSALLFLYKHVLGQDLPWLGEVVHAKRPVRLPVVLTRGEVKALLAQLRGAHWLMASILYGAGLRLMECLRLRVKDVDIAYRQILVREGKGGKDRVTMLPETAVQRLHEQLGKVKRCHEIDLRAKATERCICLTRWRANTRASGASGAGSMFFVRASARPIPRTV